MDNIIKDIVNENIEMENYILYLKEEINKLESEIINNINMLDKYNE